jgi:hypothetical protein
MMPTFLKNGPIRARLPKGRKPQPHPNRSAGHDSSRPMFTLCTYNRRLQFGCLPGGEGVPRVPHVGTLVLTSQEERPPRRCKQASLSRTLSVSFGTVERFSGSGDEESREVWAAIDALVLKAAAIALSETLGPAFSKQCFHIAGRGGAKAAVRDVDRAALQYPFVFRSDVKDNTPTRPLLGRSSEDSTFSAIASRPMGWSDWPTAPSSNTPNGKPGFTSKVRARSASGNTFGVGSAG